MKTPKRAPNKKGKGDEVWDKNLNPSDVGLPNAPKQKQTATAKPRPSAPKRRAMRY